MTKEQVETLNRMLDMRVDFIFPNVEAMSLGEVIVELEKLGICPFGTGSNCDYCPSGDGIEYALIDWPANCDKGSGWIVSHGGRWYWLPEEFWPKLENPAETIQGLLDEIGKQLPSAFSKAVMGNDEHLRRLWSVVDELAREVKSLGD